MGDEPTPAHGYVDVPWLLLHRAADTARSLGGDRLLAVPTGSGASPRLEPSQSFQSRSRAAPRIASRPGRTEALWFTENFGNKIGRITTAGAFTEFPLPTPFSNPDNITAGPDGALWFTESASNKIGRITTAGVITEFPIPTRDSTPQGITGGPDGALWFTEESGEKIGRISVSHAADVRNLPRLHVIRQGQGTVTSSPSGINCVPDCIAYYNQGTSVTLTATPATGWVFVRWEQECQETIPACSVTVTGDVTVRAVFARA